MTEDKLTPLGRRLTRMIEFDSNEKVYREVRKDLFGLFIIYFMGSLITLTFTALLTWAATYDFQQASAFAGVDVNSIGPILVIVSFFLIVGSVIMTAIGSFLYRNNVVLITSEKLAQLLYLSIFNRKISQLSIADVQDVTVTQKGIFAHIFDYGTLTVETAGEQSNYVFTFTPKPYEVAKSLVGSHEADAALHGN